MDISEYARILIGLIIIIDPLGAIPIFISLTDRYSEDNVQNKISFITSVATAIILMIFFLSGRWILDFFSISLASFQVAGGILIFLMSISMLYGKKSDAKFDEESEYEEAKEKDNVAIVPLATPLLAGPGAISNVIVQSYQIRAWWDYFVITGIVIFVASLIYLTFRLAPTISKMIGHTTMNALTRLMGLILSSIAIEIIVKGLFVLFPTLKA